MSELDGIFSGIISQLHIKGTFKNNEESRRVVEDIYRSLRIGERTTVGEVMKGLNQACIARAGNISAAICKEGTVVVETRPESRGVGAGTIAVETLVRKCPAKCKADCIRATTTCDNPVVGIAERMKEGVEINKSKCGEVEIIIRKPKRRWRWWG